MKSITCWIKTLNWIWKGWIIHHWWENEPFLLSELHSFSMKYMLFTKELFFSWEWSSGRRLQGRWVMMDQCLSVICSLWGTGKTTKEFKEQRSWSNDGLFLHGISVMTVLLIQDEIVFIFIIFDYLTLQKYAHSIINERVLPCSFFVAECENNNSWDCRGLNLQKQNCLTLLAV